MKLCFAVSFALALALLRSSRTSSGKKDNHPDLVTTGSNAEVRTLSQRSPYVYLRTLSQLLALVSATL